MTCALVAPAASFHRVALWLVGLALAATPARAAVSFSDVTLDAGFDYSHGYVGGPLNNQQAISGGAAAGDFDGDGWVDLFIARGDVGPNLLFRNLGNGQFMDVGVTAGVALPGTRHCGPTFADIDGDGWLDLILGGVQRTAVRMFRNRGDGTFEDITAGCGIDGLADTYSSAFGDYDRDGDLDLFVSHWNQPGTPNKLYRNEGNARFIAADRLADIIGFNHPDDGLDYTFTPNFADIDNDGWPDLLVAGDFTTSQVLLNNRDGTFRNVTSPVISDENGMGAAVGDYDHDGDLDWFVSSIWDTTTDTGGGQEAWGVTGNRFYRNVGDGTFEDVTDAAGVRVGHWGWGSTFGDFDNDGHLDLFHVNGWVHHLFVTDPALLYMSNGDGTFSDRAVDAGVADTGQGRGVVCFDYDRDGDLDLFIANNSQAPKLYRNDGGHTSNYLTVRLEGEAPNTQAIGARLYLTAAGRTQMRELRAGSNFETQNPVEAHFGLGAATQADRLRIVWPDASSDTLEDVSANQYLTLDWRTLRGVTPSIALAPARPNPFVDATRIEFGLPRDARVDLRIYDLNGRERVRLVDGVLGAGSHVIAWDGRDAAGRAVPSGLYFVRLVAGTAAKSTQVIRVQ